MEPSIEVKKDSEEGEREVIAGGVALADLEPPDRSRTTRKWELWSYYIYYIGNSGLGPFNFAPTYAYIQWLQTHGSRISFAIQVVLFLLIGSMADFGTWRRYILVVFSAVSFGLSFGWLGVDTPEQWQTATGMYIVGLM
ncbi:hypothetical protein RQP46_002115 [Phenoliferia psychrophenolica]